MEKRYSNALTPLSQIIFSSDYFFQSFCSIWVSVTPSNNSLTISLHNLALLHSALLHSYPVPLKFVTIFVGFEYLPISNFIVMIFKTLAIFLLLFCEQSTGSQNPEAIRAEAVRRLRQTALARGPQGNESVAQGKDHRREGTHKIFQRESIRLLHRVPSRRALA